MDIKRYYPVAVFVAAIIAIQLAASLAGATYYLTQLTMAAYYALVVLGLCLLMGYAGQISLGQAGFFAIGGYTAAIFSRHDFSAYAGTGFFKLMLSWKLALVITDTYGRQTMSFAPWVGLVAAVILTIAVAYLIGVPVLKLRGHYLAMATLGFGVIVYRVVLGTGFCGQADGINDVPALTLLPGVQVSGNMSLRVLNYYIAWIVVLAGVVLIINLINSRVGRALRSLHGGEEAAQAVGVDAARYKLTVFIISAVFAALGGVLLTHFNGGIGPSEAGVMKSIRYVAIVAVGGMANVWGALISGTVLNYLSLRGYFGSYDDAMFGFILILVMLFAPDGILKKIRSRRRITTINDETQTTH
jgi:branched-chain amino acid transport system permease protein